MALSIAWGSMTPAPVTLDEAPDDGLPAARKVADRDQAAVHRRLSGSIQT